MTSRCNFLATTFALHAGNYRVAWIGRVERAGAKPAGTVGTIATLERIELTRR